MCTLSLSAPSQLQHALPPDSFNSASITPAFQGFAHMKVVNKNKKKPSVSFLEPMDRKARVSSNIVEESPPGTDVLPEPSLLSTETKSEGFESIDMVSNPTPTMKANMLGSKDEEVFVGSSSNGKSSSSRGLPPKPKAKIRSGTLNMEEAAILALGGLQPPPTSEKSPLLSSGSLTGLVSPIDRATSMPDDHYITFNSNGVGHQQPIYRSRSVPVSYADGNIRDKHVRVLRVVPRKILSERNSGLSSASSIHDGEDDQEDITEDEAVCRICFEELGDELETFKLECKCKGDMALVHKECCQKWFNIRGNKTCEICKSEVQNITVKVRRMPAINLSNLHHLQQPPMLDADRLWHEFPILVVASIISYFMSFSLIQKTRRDEGDINKQYSIPASCILGLITSLAASTFAKRKHVWVYALVQFLIFALFALILYGLIHLEPLTTLIVATVIAMGISRGAGPVYRAIKKLRVARQNQLNNNSQNSAPPLELQPAHESC